MRLDQALTLLELRAQERVVLRVVEIGMRSMQQVRMRHRVAFDIDAGFLQRHDLRPRQRV